MEVNVYSFDRIGLHKAALEFAEDRMTALRQFMDKLEYGSHESRTVQKLRRKMMRKQIEAARSQLKALDALLRLDIEEME